MNLIDCQLRHLRQRCEQRGVPLATAMAAVVRQDGEQITVDVDHPAYPRANATPANPAPQPPAPDRRAKPARSPPAGSRSWELVTGPKMWAELHTKAGADAAWMAAFTARIPCGDCKNHWRSLLKELPPDYTSDAAFRAWTVAAHNRVNERLGKPVLRYSEVATRWGWGCCGGAVCRPDQRLPGSSGTRSVDSTAPR